MTLDGELALEGQSGKRVSKLLAAGQTLAAGLTDTGFGHPFLATHFVTRVKAKALAGVECLASSRKGSRCVVTGLKCAQYTVAKGFIGAAAGVSMGSHAAVLAETRLLMRTGTAAAVRVIMARARAWYVCLGATPPYKWYMHLVPGGDCQVDGGTATI